MQLWMGSKIRLRCRCYASYLWGKTFLHADPGNIRRMADHSIRRWSATGHIHPGERQPGSADCSDNSSQYTCVSKHLSERKRFHSIRSFNVITFLITRLSVSTFRRKVPRCCAKTRRTLKCLLIVIAICVIMNAATLVSIGYHISVRQETLIEIFNTSMHLYVSAASYKYSIDEIQFIFQCCGHSSYTDWFLFDWQVNPPFQKGNSKHGITSVSKKHRILGNPIVSETYSSIRE